MHVVAAHVTRQYHDSVVPSLVVYTNFGCDHAPILRAQHERTPLISHWNTTYSSSYIYSYSLNWIRFYWRCTTVAKSAHGVIILIPKWCCAYCRRLLVVTFSVKYMFFFVFFFIFSDVLMTKHFSTISKLLCGVHLLCSFGVVGLVGWHFVYFIFFFVLNFKIGVSQLTYLKFVH